MDENELETYWDSAWRTKRLNIENKHLTLSQIRRIAEFINEKAMFEYIDKIGKPQLTDLKDIKLKNLVLKGCKINDEGAKYLAEALKVNKTLETLSLSNNEISLFGVQYIIEALRQNKNLQELRLSNNKIEDEGAYLVAQYLSENKSLKRIFLKNNNISDKGINTIAEALKQNTNLVSLSFIQNQKNSPNIKIEASNYTLKKKNSSLISAQATNESIKSFIDTLKINNTLKFLSLGEHSQDKLKPLLSLNNDLAKLVEYISPGYCGTIPSSEIIQKYKNSEKQIDLIKCLASLQETRGSTILSFFCRSKIGINYLSEENVVYIVQSIEKELKKNSIPFGISRSEKGKNLNLKFNNLKDYVDLELKIKITDENKDNKAILKLNNELMKLYSVEKTSLQELAYKAILQSFLKEVEKIYTNTHYLIYSFKPLANGEFKKEDLEFQKDSNLEFFTHKYIHLTHLNENFILTGHEARLVTYLKLLFPKLETTAVSNENENSVLQINDIKYGLVGNQETDSELS